ncbi:MAG: hypothetical protein MJ249_08955 [Kiritimatiellae bacterium]|nr:hypothetical protein [Kiritimatiellia bacterium]
MKSSQIAIGMLLALCAGCATKEMSSTPFYTGHEVKYTGRVEDRVNLWPAAYYRAPVGSIAWPLISFSDDHFAFRPLYSQYQKHGANVYNEFNVLWPIAQFDTHEDIYRIFPLIWGNGDFCLFPEVWKGPDWWGVFPFFMDNDADWVTVFPLFFSDFAGSDRFHTLFPLYYHSSESFEGHEASYFWTALGLWGYKRQDGAFLNHRILPLYYADRDSIWSIPYAHFDEGATKRDMFLGGLAGRKTINDQYDSSWFFPLFYHNAEGDFASLLWGCERNLQRDTTFSMVPPLLSWYERDGNRHEMYGLLGLGAYRTDGQSSSSWLFPLYYNDDKNFVTPLFGRTEDCGNWCLPLYWRDEEKFCSLLWYQERGADGQLNTAVSPLLLSGWSRDERTGDSQTKILLGLGGAETSADGHSKSWAFPLFYQDDDLFVTALFGKTKTSDWIVPLYYRDEESFVTPLFGMSGQARWIAPLFYTDDELLLTPLYGQTKTSSWLFPLYYRDNDGFVTLLGGGNADSSWILPFYYKEQDNFLSLPYCRFSEKDHWTTHVVPPLLSSYAKQEGTGREKTKVLLGLAGSSTGDKGEREMDWIFPLYYHEKDRRFISLFAGYTGGGTSLTNTWWCTPLVGTRSGSKNGGWIAPVFDRTVDRDYAAIKALGKGSFLPPEVTFYEKAETNYTWVVSKDNPSKGEKKAEIVKRKCSKDRFASDKTELFLVSDHNRSVVASLDYRGKHYRVRENYKHGNKLVFNRSGYNSVVFDPETRQKLGEESKSEVDVLCDLLFRWASEKNQLRGDSSWDCGLLTVLFNGSNAVFKNGTEDGFANVLGLLYHGTWDSHGSESSILWKIWHRVEKDGDVSVDMFPGFTYDAHKDGYRKTSFLWRFFRSEHDPKKGDSLDFLFLPIVRP